MLNGGIIDTSLCIRKGEQNIMSSMLFKLVGVSTNCSREYVETVLYRVQVKHEMEHYVSYMA